MNKEPQVKTEVTSVAKEELDKGIKIKTPTSEELVIMAHRSFITSRKAFNMIFDSLSARGKNRVMNAVLDLPADNLPVYLKDDAEKRAFATGQRIISDRFLITYHHIVQEAKKAKEQAKTSEPLTEPSN